MAVNEYAGRPIKTGCGEAIRGPGEMAKASEDGGAKSQLSEIMGMLHAGRMWLTLVVVIVRMHCR